MGDAQSLEAIKSALGDKSIVMVGLMGCGKSAVGRRLPRAWACPSWMPTRRSRRRAGQSIEDMFAEHGEPYFREGERKVLARLMAAGTQVWRPAGVPS